MKKIAHPDDVVGSGNGMTWLLGKKQTVQTRLPSQTMLPVPCLPIQTHFAVQTGGDSKTSTIGIARQKPTNSQIEAAPSVTPNSTAEDGRKLELPITRSVKNLKESRGKRRAAAAAAAAAKVALSDHLNIEVDAQMKNTYDSETLKNIQKRVKNRESVEKCRLKKKMRLAGLEIEKEDLIEENRKMKEVLMQLESSDFSFSGNI